MTPIEACPPIEEIEGLAQGRLEPAHSTRVSAHVTVCSKCSERLVELRSDRELGERLRRALGGMNEPALPTIEGYRVVREVGRGGMGVVYEAEQLAPKRRVALKVVRGVQYVDAQTLRLFQREIRVLARLEHPGIASLYDAGETGGEHWFAMEFVEGKPLTLHARSLATAAKLERFLQLCEAIDYAHRQGVVHRDLKPSNVLVTDSGRVQVLDFGLAKITDADVSIATEAGHIRGTLAYMSPEQARGDPSAIGLQSDVYSLGVILYEMLCNALPIDTSGVPIHEAARRVALEPPRRPSAIVPELRGDLETIMSKALEKDAHRRYAGAAALAEDVRRFLANEVILARPPSTAYELKKLVARHKLPFALASIVFVGAVGTAVWTAILYGRESDLLAAQSKLSQERQTALLAEREQREQAEKAREEAHKQTKLAEARLEQSIMETAARDASLGFLVDIFSDVRPKDKKSSKLTADELLRGAIDRLDERKEKSAAARMMILSSVGTAAMRAGMLDEASKLLEESVEIARRDQPGQPVLASLLASLGLLRGEQGRTAESLELLKESDIIFAATQGSESKNSITARVNFANGLRESGNAHRAAEILREALAATESSEEAREKRLLIQSSLGLALYDLRESDDARTLLTAAIAEHEPKGASVGLANLKHALGLALYVADRDEEARVQFQAALDIRLQLLDPDDDALSSSYNALSAIAKDSGDLDTALDLSAKANAIQVKRHGADSPKVALFEFNRARVLIAKGDLDEAEPLVRHSLEVRRKHFGNDSARVAENFVVLAEIATKRQDPHGAEPLLLDAIRILDLRLGKPNPTTIQARFRLVQCLMAQERHAEAREVMGEIQTVAKTSKQLNATQLQGIHDLSQQLESVANKAKAGAAPTAGEAGSQPK